MPKIGFPASLQRHKLPIDFALSPMEKPKVLARHGSTVPLPSYYDNFSLFCPATSLPCREKHLLSTDLALNPMKWFKNCWSIFSHISWGQPEDLSLVGSYPHHTLKLVPSLPLPTARFACLDLDGLYYYLRRSRQVNMWCIWTFLL